MIPDRGFFFLGVDFIAFFEYRSQSMADYIDKIIQIALDEDLSNRGDVTTDYSVAEDITGVAVITARDSGVLAGIDVAVRVFRRIDSELVLEPHFRDGDAVEAGQSVLRIRGRCRSILTAERTALNFMQRLSGIATLTSRYVRAIRGTGVKILDTRKTTPGLRQLEKYAVRAGGGHNHRFGLYDMVLLKENHIAAAGGASQAVRSVRQAMRMNRRNLPIEVEVSKLDQIGEVLELQVDRIMLDNMSITETAEAVSLIDGKIETEVSGGISLANVGDYAQTGVNFISVGALTHSAPALDLSLIVNL